MSIAERDAPRRRARRRQRQAFVLAGLAGLLGPTIGGPLAGGASRAAAVSGGAWVTYGGSGTRDGLQPYGPALPRLHRLWRSGQLDGAVYGEALIDARRVDVATEADTVYSFAAGSGHLMWRRHLGTPVPAAMLPCGDISPTVGITSTMVLDPARRELFASAAVLVGGQIHHEIVALAATSGKVLWRRDIALFGFAPATHLQRSALALADGRVVAGFGGNYGDCGDYRGTVVGVPESGTGPLSAYRVPTAKGGAVWAPSGVAVTSAGDLLFSTANGASTTAYDEGDSVVALTPAFRRAGYFAPANWRQLNASDGDLGSAAPMLLPGGGALVLGKNATAFLVSAAHLGGIGGERAATAACFSIGGDAYRAPLAYVACPDGSLLALHVGVDTLRPAWRGPAGTDGSPTIAGGLVWVIGAGELHGLAPNSGRQRVALPVLATEHYVAPSAGEGLLVVAGARAVEAFAGPAGWRP